MKTISKRALSVLLAVLMIISAFAVVPLTASAETGTNIVAAGAFRDAAGHYLRIDHKDVDLTKDSGENWKATAEEKENGETHLDFLVPEYYNGQLVAEITKIAVHFENEVGSTQMGVSINTATSSNEFTLLHGYEANSFTAEAKDLTYGDMEDETPIERPEIIRISMVGIEEEVTPEISWVEVEATLKPVSVKTLFKSHKLEWSGDAADTIDSFTITRKAVGSEEDATDITEKVNCVSEATYDGKKYFTVLDDMTVTPDTEGATPYIDTTDYEYEIKKGDQSVGKATATDNPGLDALKKNALIYFDYGVDGSVFAAETEAEKVLDAGDNGQVRGARLEALNQFSVGVTFMTEKANAALFSSAKDDTTKGLSINAAGNISAQLTGLNYTTTGTVTDGEVHSFVGSVSADKSYYNLDGSTNDTDNQTGAGATVDLQNIEGLFVGSQAFEGTIYSVLFSEEEYTVDELNIITEVRSSILLANEIKQAESSVESIQDKNTKAIVKNAIGYSKRVIDLYKAGSASQALCAVQLDDLKKAQEGKYVVRAYAGQSAISITIKDGESEAVTDVTSVSCEGTAGNEKTVVVEAGDPSVKGLDFAGWTNRLGQPILLKETGETVEYNNGTETVTVNVYEAQPVGDESEDYTVPADMEILALKVSGPVIVVASFGGLNGDLSALRPIDKDVLKKNARTNSEQNPKVDKDGPIIDAFDGDPLTHWHSRYGGNIPSAETNTNKFSDGTLCEQDKNGIPNGEGHPIWIQTGFDEPKIVAGFKYTPRTTGGHTIPLKYEIKVSNDEKFEDASTRTVSSGEFPYDYLNPQTIYFPPTEGQYIRFIYYSVDKSKDQQDGHANAAEIDILEFTPNESFDVDITVNGQVIYTMTIDDGRLTTDITDADLVKEGLQDKFNDLEDKLDDIKYNYDFDVDNYSSAKCELAAVQTPAHYTLTADVDGDKQESTKNYNEPFDQVVAPETDKNSTGSFSHWVLTDNDKQPIGYGRYFNYVASGNLDIKAVYSEEPNTDVGAYIPAPVYSVERTNHIVEVPVSLFNVADKELQDFGLVIVKDDTDDTTIENAINGTASDNVIISSAFEAKKDELTNKGRYLHRLKIAQTAAAKIRAYVKVGDKVYLSKPQELKQLDAIPEEEGVLPVIPETVTD